MKLENELPQSEQDRLNKLYPTIGLLRWPPGDRNFPDGEDRESLQKGFSEKMEKKFVKANTISSEMGKKLAASHRIFTELTSSYERKVNQDKLDEAFGKCQQSLSEANQAVNDFYGYLYGIRK